MRILHFRPTTSESMITDYVNVLCDTMGEYAEVTACDSLMAFKRHIKKDHPDIVHLHGCWHTSIALAARVAHKKGIRFVHTPHGQLEPWIVKQDYWRDKFPRILLFQRKVVHKAYSVIAMGRMEENSIKRLGWNTRIEVVHNSLITESVTAQDMCRQIYTIYRKVLDSDVLKLMSDNTSYALRALIKAGQTGDDRWLDDKEYNSVKAVDDTGWRQLLLYSYQEGFADTMRDGIRVVNANVPDVNASEVPCYYPARFVKSTPLLELTKKGLDANKSFVAMIKAMRKLILHRKLTFSHVVELAAVLRSQSLDEDKVAMELENANLTKFAGRIMQLLSDLTGLDEGFMPVAPVDKTGNIKRIITKHLEI